MPDEEFTQVTGKLRENVRLDGVLRLVSADANSVFGSYLHNRLGDGVGTAASIVQVGTSSGKPFASEDAKASALQSTLGGVRSSIAAFRTSAVISGEDPYPTLEELTDGTTIKFEIPANPFSGLDGVQSVSLAQATSRAVINETGVGWNYHVNNTANPPVAIFYANSESETTILDNAGAAREANEL